VGGRSAGYERSLRQARDTAIEEMVAEAEQLGADAVIGVNVDYESIQMGQGDGMRSALQGPQSSSSGLLAADARPPDVLQPYCNLL
jgi:uncharacterized protein YbjQ (UPF0145 family)